MKVEVGGRGRGSEGETRNRTIGGDRQARSAMEVNACQVLRLLGPPSRSLPDIDASAVSAVTVPKTRNSGVAYGRFGSGAGGRPESLLMGSARFNVVSLWHALRPVNARSDIGCGDAAD